MPLVDVYADRFWFPADAQRYDQLPLQQQLTADVIRGLPLMLSVMFHELDGATYPTDQFLVSPRKMSDWAMGASDWQIIVRPPEKQFLLFNNRRTEARMADIADHVHAWLQDWFENITSSEQTAGLLAWPSYDIDVIPFSGGGLSATQYGDVTDRW